MNNAIYCQKSQVLMKSCMNLLLYKGIVILLPGYPRVEDVQDQNGNTMRVIVPNPW